MRVQILNTAAFPSVPDDGAETSPVTPMISRWCAVQGKFVTVELDWDDPLDAAVALQAVSFRAGVDHFDA